MTGLSDVIAYATPDISIMRKVERLVGKIEFFHSSCAMPSQGMTLLSDVLKQIQEKLVPIAGVIVNRPDLVGIPGHQVPNNDQYFLRPAKREIQSVSVTDKASARGIPGWLRHPRMLKEGISQMPEYSE
ncbi:hypothetical protein GB937_000788 [Aspergillus fischeri]|nr:hypothetical protein GB937_000788 [Aspergillus fischeri]